MHTGETVHHLGHRPALYGEEQLRLRTPGEGHRPAGGLVGELMAELCPAARVRRVAASLRSVGFDGLEYGQISLQNGRCQPLSFFTSHAPPGWVARYVALRHFENDARWLEAPGSGLPLIWDLGSLAGAPGAGLPRQRFIDDLRAAGISSGLLIRLASPAQPGEHTVIGLVSRAESRQWIGDPVVGQALMLALNVHEYVSRCAWGPEAASASRGEVSETQQVILDQLLQGRCDKEIAYHLQLSLHAVDYHMRQLRRRFAARNRLQLVNAVMASQRGRRLEEAVA